MKDLSNLFIREIQASDPKFDPCLFKEDKISGKEQLKNLEAINLELKHQVSDSAIAWIQSNFEALRDIGGGKLLFKIHSANF